MVERPITPEQAFPRVLSNLSIGRVKEGAVTRVSQFDFSALLIPNAAKFQVRAIYGGKNAIELVERVRSHC